MFEKNPKVVNSSDLLKQNRCVSYMSFILKEVCDFFLAKTNNGVPVFKLKLMKDEINKIKEHIEKLESCANK
jgi:hypothetical protein